MNIIYFFGCPCCKKKKENNQMRIVQKKHEGPNFFGVCGYFLMIIFFNYCDDI